MQEILIVVDMQNDFIDGALGTAEAAGIVDQVREKILCRPIRHLAAAGTRGRARVSQRRNTAT